MGGFIGAGLSLALSARRVSYASKRWALYTGAQYLTFEDGANIGTAFALAAGAFISTPQAISATLSGVLSGTGPLRKSGVGTVTISGANTYTAGTVIDSGIVNCGSVDAFGTGPVTVNAGAVLNLQGNVIANGITNNGGTVNP